MKDFVKLLPEYDYLYLGDNARSPYGTRSFDSVYHYTLECVRYLFERGCRLVILACNTASAKALRTIQQQDLPGIDPSRRVLGVIRPTAEIVGNMSHTGHVGVFATAGTVASASYPLEIAKFYPHLNVYQEACPMWVPLVENEEHNSHGADFFVKKHLSRLLAKSRDIDSILLGCTHYPLLINKIKQFLPPHIRLVPQGEIVANSLADYLRRHPEMEAACSRGGRRSFLTTDSPEIFDQRATIFFGEKVESEHIFPYLCLPF